MIYTLITAGGFLFWGLLITFIVLCEWTTIDDSHGSFVWLVFLLAMLTLFSDVNPFIWLWHNKMTALADLIIYVILGIGWGFMKWYFYLKNAHDKITLNETMFRDNYGLAQKKINDPFKG